ncbi:MAG: glutamate 5-kinase [Ruminococcaceae bacterium]|nr:glutamate 5-kinase [Oscillospiraceae bacterium]
MRIVVKVGTTTLAHKTGHLNIRHMEELCKVLSDIKNAGDEVILVSSGAIGMGMGKLQLKERPKTLPGKQACAAVGQCELMYTYDKCFSEYNHTIAQILLTGGDINDPVRRQNFINTMEHLLEMQVLPIINENDTVSTDEIVIGDNDTLAAIVATAAGADLLILLSDIDGLYSADPRKDKNAVLIDRVTELTPEIMALGGESASGMGTGGMATKLNAAKIATESGCDMIIANGSHPSILYSIMDGDGVGTRFVSGK